MYLVFFAASKINKKGGVLYEKKDICNSVLCEKNKTVEKWGSPYFYEDYSGCTED
jgi:hypothetical protein